MLTAGYTSSSAPRFARMIRSQAHRRRREIIMPRSAWMCRTVWQTSWTPARPACCADVPQMIVQHGPIRHGSCALGPLPMSPRIARMDLQRSLCHRDRQEGCPREARMVRARRRFRPGPAPRSCADTRIRSCPHREDGPRANALAGREPVLKRGWSWHRPEASARPCMAYRALAQTARFLWGPNFVPVRPLLVVSDHGLEARSSP